MDINMPDLNGVDAARQILAELPRTRIIALSMYSDRSYVKGMLKAGVAGYLLKNCAFEELSKAVLAVVGHQTYLSPKISDVVRKEFVKMMDSGEAGSVAEVLTDKERRGPAAYRRGQKDKGYR
jgi:two-component system, NarL family, response regulator NreC